MKKVLFLVILWVVLGFGLGFFISYGGVKRASRVVEDESQKPLVQKVELPFDAGEVVLQTKSMVTAEMSAEKAVEVGLGGGGGTAGSRFHFRQEMLRLPPELSLWGT